MRVSVVLLVVALLGVLGGGWLAGGAAGLGGCLIFDSLCAGAWALCRDDGEGALAREPGLLTVEDVLRKAERVP